MVGLPRPPRSLMLDILQASDLEQMCHFRNCEGLTKIGEHVFVHMIDIDVIDKYT